MRNVYGDIKGECLSNERNKCCKGGGQPEVVCWACEESICTACAGFGDVIAFRREHERCKRPLLVMQ